MSLNATVARVTDRIVERSGPLRRPYLDRMARARDAGTTRAHLSCGNQAHAYAAMPEADKALLAEGTAGNLGIVTAYNDMLSAHQPYERYPELIRQAARAMGGTAQVAGGVPAMCDGVTQGQPGMELSLFSRDVIAMAAGIALSHNTFDAAVYLGVCDKIVPGLVIAAATFGHIPAVFLPAGPMTSRHPERPEGQGPPAVRHRRGRPRRADGGRDGLLPRAGHLHLLRHRQHQPDADGVHGPAPAGLVLRQPEHALARRADHRGCAPGAGDLGARQRVHAGLRRARRARLRQRHRRAERHRRLDQPADPPDRDGAGGRRPARLGGLRRALGRDAADGAGLSERARRREPLPRRRGPGLHDRRAARGRAAAPRHPHRRRRRPRPLHPGAEAHRRGAGLGRGHGRVAERQDRAARPATRSSRRAGSSG